jgi:hypothetical protein
VVWEVVGHRFDRVAEWTGLVRSSCPLPGAPSVEGAKVAGRVCRTGIPMFPEVTERIVAYDEAARTLTYEAALLPPWLPSARNQWRVEEVDDTRTRVSLRAHVQTRGVLGRLAYLLLRVALARSGPRILRDLRRHVEQAQVR